MLFLSALKNRAAIPRLDGFAACRSGVAGVEFAIIAPVMVIMFVGVVELSQAITAERRMSQVMASTADLVARQKNVNQTMLEGYMQMVTPMMNPYPAAPLKMTIASVYAPSSAPTTNKVCWKFDHNGGAVAVTKGATSTIPIPTGLLTSGGTSVVAVEVSYDYVPAIQFTHSFVGALSSWRSRFYLKPRLTSIIQWTGDTPSCN